MDTRGQWKNLDVMEEGDQGKLSSVFIWGLEILDHSYLHKKSPLWKSLTDYTVYWASESPSFCTPTSGLPTVCTPTVPVCS